MPEVEPAALAAAIAVVALGSAVQGAVGFGLALVAAPLLVTIDPGLVPGPLLCAAMTLVALSAYRDRGAIETSALKWSLVGRLPGAAAGALTVAWIPVQQLGLLVSGLVLFAVVLSVSGLRIRPSPRTLLGAGALSGFMGTAVAIGGPPMALLYQHEPGPRLRGTLGMYFVLGGLVSLAALRLAGRLGAEELRWAALLIPGVLLGFVAATRLTPLLDRGHSRSAVLGTSVLAGLVPVVRYALG